MIYDSIFLQQEIQNASYGQDLSKVEQLYKEHQTKHEEIMNLKEEVEKECKQTVRVVPYVSHRLVLFGYCVKANQFELGNQVLTSLLNETLCTLGFFSVE